MSAPDPRQAAAVARFRELHAADCFVLPNPWDIGSAVFLEHLGFQALATTSAGFAFSRGLPDDVGAVPRDLMLGHFREIAEATSIPINADFQGGYADAPEAVAENVDLCVATGVAGLSIEDNTGRVEAPLYETSLAVERIRAARSSIDSSGTGVLLTARCEAWLVGVREPFAVARERLVRFAEAGADCLFAPGVSEPAEIAELVAAVAPKPLNVLVSTHNRTLSVRRLADLGVRRISVGGALARVAWGAFLRGAREICQDGTFESFGSAVPFDEINDLFAGRR